MEFKEWRINIREHLVHFIVAILLVGSTMVPTFDYLYKSRIEERDATIQDLKRRLQNLQSKIAGLEKQSKGAQSANLVARQIREPQIEIQAASIYIEGIGSVAPDQCTHARPCEGLIRGATLRIELTRRGYASAFLRDKWGNFFQQNGEHIVSNLTEGTLPLWPGTSEEISHQDFGLFIVTSEEPIPTYTASTVLKTLPTGKNGYTPRAVYLRVPARGCGARRCPQPGT